MEFTVEFYETRSGTSPVREFLDELKEDNPDDFAIIMAGLAKLRNRVYHRSPLSKPLRGAYSDAKRPPIPIQTGHLFRSKSAGHSDSNRPPLSEG
jgi:hypothetical protein